jgi:NAD(P)H-hydrate epimerase
MRKYMLSDGSAVMSRDEVRGVDEWAIKTMGIPSAVLMENAGRSCAEFILAKLGWHRHPAHEKHGRDGHATVCIFCGTGNNGGDGYVVARHLYNAGIRCRVIICGNALKIKGDAKINLDIIMKMGIPIQQIDVDWRDIENKVRDFTRGASLIIDGLFGTGLQGQLADNFISLINALNERGIPIVAIDIPSGLDCDTGRPLGAAIKAMATITFVAVKKGFVADPASAQYTGDIYVASIGIEPKK